MKLNGSEILLECLLEQNVDVVFGYPGGAVLNIYDALYKYSDRIRHIRTSHEQGACHAADGYARATGRTGVVIATSGPGATNLVTGIATAYMDSVPIVAITGQVPTSLLGKDSFQEIDITGITIPITKHNYIVKDVSDLADIVREAFLIARTGRPGPVLIDICKNATSAVAEYSRNDDFYSHRLDKIKLNCICGDTSIKEAAALINSSERPFILSGGGVTISDSNDLLFELAVKARIPVATTLMGVSSFPVKNELFTGLVGMHGSVASNRASDSCDLLIAIGARFSDRVVGDIEKFAVNAKIIHIDIDPAEINKNIITSIELIGDIRYILERLNGYVAKREDSCWNMQIAGWKAAYPVRHKDDGALRPQYIIETLSKMTNDDAVITTEVGQNQLWAAQFYGYSAKRQFISSGGLGTMGYGLGACIGARIGRPDKKVINIAGDGSFKMNANELSTAVHYRLPVIIAILNNGVLGMVRQWQNLFYQKRFSQTTGTTETDFVKLAEAYGAIGIRVTKPEEVIPAFTRALMSENTPVLIDFVIDEDEMVYPIVPPGKPISELILD
jgi:acetolactate synthase I/II/III large subunit